LRLVKAEERQWPWCEDKNDWFDVSKHKVEPVGQRAPPFVAIEAVFTQTPVWKPDIDSFDTIFRGKARLVTIVAVLPRH